ncbi:MAG TPA: hypothetical protein VIL94_01920 [Acidothermaceae bacterium]
MTLAWRSARIELVDGYVVLDSAGKPTAVVENARVAIEGGFVHVEVAGSPEQAVSAPAVRLISYIG